MRSFPPPALKHGDVFQKCASHISNDANDPDLTSMACGRAVGAALHFHDLVEPAEEGVRLLYFPQVSNEDDPYQKALYERALVPQRSPARTYYNAILLSAPHRLCPYCGVSVVSTLDHYLPKSIASTLSVFPLNLVPCCAACNRNKLDGWPAEPAEQPLHPYFDDTRTTDWLRAVLVPSPDGEGVYAHYFIARWLGGEARRVSAHFERFKLRDLYGAQAANELTYLQGRLDDLRDSGGPDAVREHLLVERDARLRSTSNHWSAALYRALARDHAVHLGKKRLA